MTTDNELGARIDELERRLDTAESVVALHQLKARYAELVDARFARGRVVDPHRLAEVAGAAAKLFTEDGVWDGGPALGVARGRSEIAARLAEPTLIFSRHLFVMPRIEVDGDRASARWDLLCPCTRPDGEAMWMCGYEDDTYSRVNGVWLHATMSLSTVFVSPVSEGWPRILT
jgi:SnoaL-like domain